MLPIAPRSANGARGSTPSADSTTTGRCSWPCLPTWRSRPISPGFAAGFGDVEGWGRYDREHNREGALLSQEITEFTNSGVAAGIACVNLSPKPLEEFDGFYSAHSTYASFSYLKYGLMRLFSQIAQDSNIKVGKVLWVAGHSGPETAEDSRTHFGIYETAVMELFPDGHVINIIPWEHNEVPVMIAAAMATDAHIVALHLTRPPIQVPDRAALGMASHFEAARGAYVIRPTTRRASRRWAPFWSRAPCRPTTRCACCRSWTSSA